jgi:hypothetical protein
MFEVKRDAAADLAMCEAATPGKWEGKHAIQPYISVFTGVAEEVIATTYTRGNMRFIAESRTALPHWIKRAVAAEAEVERLREALRSISTYEPPPGCEDIGIEVMNGTAKRALEKT